MSAFSIFSGKNNFSTLNIAKTIEDYERILYVDVSLINDLATDAFFRHKTINIMAFVFMLVILYQMQGEQENGMLQIVRASRGGRFNLALKRQLIIAGMIFVTVVSLYVATLVGAFYEYGGMTSLKLPIQSIEGFSRYTQVHNQWQVILSCCIKNTLVIYALLCVVWFFLVTLRNRKLVFAIMAAIYGFEFVCYTNISIQSVYRWLRQINIFNLFEFNEIIRSYLNIGKATWVLSVEDIVLVFAGMIAVILPVISIVTATFKKSGVSFIFVERLNRIIEKYVQMALCNMHICLKELYKIVASGSAVLLIVGLALVSIYFCIDGKMHYSQEQNMLDRKYIECGGSDYLGYKEELLKLQADLENAVTKKMEAVNANEEYYKEEAYWELADEVTRLDSRVKAYSEVYVKLEYLDELKSQRGIDGYLMTDRGYEEVIGKYGLSRWNKLLFGLSAVVVLVISEGFNREYVSGMSALIRSSQRGRVYFYIRKIAACILTSTFLYAIVFNIDGNFLNAYYSFQYPEAPVQSLTYMKDCRLNISIREYIIWQHIIMYCFTLLITALVCTVMLIAGRKNGKIYVFIVMVVSIAASNMLLTSGMNVPYVTMICMLAVTALIFIAGKNLWCCSKELLIA